MHVRRTLDYLKIVAPDFDEAVVSALANDEPELLKRLEGVTSRFRKPSPRQIHRPQKLPVKQAPA